MRRQERAEQRKEADSATRIVFASLLSLSGQVTITRRRKYFVPEHVGGVELVYWHFTRVTPSLHERIPNTSLSEESELGKAIRHLGMQGKRLMHANQVRSSVVK